MQIGLYRDLAVGVSDAGSETWADTGELCQDVSIGAPPDILSTWSKLGATSAQPAGASSKVVQAIYRFDSSKYESLRSVAN